MMNYLKKFESFQTHNEIHKICEEYNITNYTINEDGSIDVNSDVDLTRRRLEKLPLKFNHIHGNFLCYLNKLTTLEGAPQSVDDEFNCSYNQLTTLEGGPQFVGNIFTCYKNKLTTLKSGPQYVGSYFDCSYNKLTTLEGAPQSVDDDFNCSYNQLTTLEGSPQFVKGDFNCCSNKLTTLEGSPQSVGDYFYCTHNKLTTLEGSPQFVGNVFDCSYNKDLKSLNYLSQNIISEEVYFQKTAVYEIFQLLDNKSLGMIRLVNDLKVVVDGEINLEILNDLLYDQGKPPVENVKGY